MLYLACWADETLLSNVLALVAEKAGLKTTPLPAHIRIRRRGNLTFAFNYGTEAWNVPETATMVLGEKTLEPQAVSVWRD
jgi:beta-galactosidase